MLTRLDRRWWLRRCGKHGCYGESLCFVGLVEGPLSRFSLLSLSCFSSLSLLNVCQSFQLARPFGNTICPARFLENRTTVKKKGQEP